MLFFSINTLFQRAKRAINKREKRVMAGQVIWRKFVGKWYHYHLIYFRISGGRKFASCIPAEQSDALDNTSQSHPHCLPSPFLPDQSVFALPTTMLLRSSRSSISISALQSHCRRSDAALLGVLSEVCSHWPFRLRTFSGVSILPCHRTIGEIRISFYASLLKLWLCGSRF